MGPTAERSMTPHEKHTVKKTYQIEKIMHAAKRKQNRLRTICTDFPVVSHKAFLQRNAIERSIAETDRNMPDGIPGLAKTAYSNPVIPIKNRKINGVFFVIRYASSFRFSAISVTDKP